MTTADGEQARRMTTKGLRQDLPSTFSTEWLTAKEAAAYLKVGHRTVCVWANQGKVPAHALSGTSRRTWRFLRSELDAMLRSS